MFKAKGKCLEWSGGVKINRTGAHLHFEHHCQLWERRFPVSD